VNKNRSSNHNNLIKKHNRTFSCSLLLISIITLGQPTNLSAKSIADLRLGNVTLGYQFTGGVETAGTVNGQAKQIDNNISGVTIGLRKRGFRFLQDKARITWDTSLMLSIFSSNLDSPDTTAPITTNWQFEGTLLNIRTGPGIEFHLANEWLLKLGTGMDTAYLDAQLEIINKSRSKGWHFGGHIDGTLLYAPHRNISIFGSGGLEKIGKQTFSDGTNQGTLDLSSNWTFSTGILFPW
jgi:hypothetical protein